MPEKMPINAPAEALAGPTGGGLFGLNYYRRQLIANKLVTAVQRLNDVKYSVREKATKEIVSILQDAKEGDRYYLHLTLAQIQHTTPSGEVAARIGAIRTREQTYEGDITFYYLPWLKKAKDNDYSYGSAVEFYLRWVVEQYPKDALKILRHLETIPQIQYQTSVIGLVRFYRERAEKK